MFFVLFFWAYAYLICYSFGSVIQKITGCEIDISTENTELQVFAGISVITSFLGLLSLFFKLSFIADCSLVAISLFIHRFSYSKLKETYSFLYKAITGGPILIKTCKITGLICLVVLSLVVPTHGDSSFYHAQAIQWIEKYPVVIGLGNLFDRLAFNSSFFVTQAGFSFSFFLDEPLHLLNSFMIFIFYTYILNLVYKSYIINDKFFIYYISNLLLSFLMFRGWISSASPDIATSILCWVSCILFIQETSDTMRFGLKFWLILLLCFTAVVFKISAAFILLLPLGMIVSYRKHLNCKYFYMIMIICFATVVPFLIRNAIISGYLVFPISEIDFFNFSWKMPEPVLIWNKIAIKAFARIAETPELVIQLPFSIWFPIWFKKLMLAYKILFVSLPACLFLILYCSIRNANIFKPLIPLVLVLVSGIVFWFINAPDFRFGLNFIIPFTSLGLWTVSHLLKVQFNRSVLTASLILVCIYLVLFSFYMIRKESLNLQIVMIKPAEYPKVSIKKIRIDSIDLNIPADFENCWNTPIPCVNEDLLHSDLKPISTTINSGFIRRNKKN